MIIMCFAKQLNKDFYTLKVEKSAVFKNAINYLMRKYDVDDFDLQYHFNYGMFQGNPVFIDYGHLYNNDCLFD